MRKSKTRKPPPLYVETYSRESSPRCSSVISDCDADDEGFMSSGEYLPSSSRSLNLSIPPGPYCPRRPTLQEVLSDAAPPPWTLSAFMAYLSQNHCHTRQRSILTTIPTDQDSEYVRMLWRKLLDAYIAPNGPREVNLPSDVRDRLMHLPNIYEAPDPRELDQAVKIIYELMDESVLVPFLNSIAPPSRASEHSPWASNESFVDAAAMAESLDERSMSHSRLRTRKGSPPLSGDKISHSHSLPSQRPPQHPHLTAALGRVTSARLSTFMSGSSGTSSIESESLTDDTDSPSPMEPITPPTTPPTSDTGFVSDSPGTSPRHSREGSVSWKKMGAKLGFKKSRSAHGSTSSSRRHSVASPLSDAFSNIPCSMNRPIENPMNNSTLTKKASQPRVDTTLKSTQGASPFMVAHPGSPVDVSGRRPSLVANLASMHVPDLGKHRRGRSMSRGIGENDVAAKLGSAVNEKEMAKAKMMQVAGSPFYIPAKVIEREEPRKSSETTTTDTEVHADFDFEGDNGTWISAHSEAHSSRTSLATTTSSTSTIMDDRSPDESLLADTSIVCSSASSIYSCSTVSSNSCASSASADIYGWEEELKRKSSEGSPTWDHRSELGAAMRRLPSGGRTMGPRTECSGGVQQLSYKRADGKRKSLLYRVLNISSTKRLNDEIPPVPTMPSFHSIQNDAAGRASP
ncbi:putative regulator of g protein signaling domain protein [Botrytis fragariae]|uniref:Putative regulator of g protein signaling domain protein n=1 Tax=Botrytis fragariae TaxID=1964551 RepID=A0A8H6AKV5_9HELO|nr:putative regulator of g protein signaling domain protein [Botrytis fragariae]KAF5869259.1 putative regulator of g protein signaling domain protein [Botrytis fragariae]